MAWLALNDDLVRGVAIGFLSALLLVCIVAVIALRSSEMYNLSHWKLNLRTPLESMWMNMGYW
jgi:hypothetical protein